MRVLLRKPTARDRAEFVHLKRASAAFLRPWTSTLPPARAGERRSPGLGRAFAAALRENRGDRNLRLLVCRVEDGAILGALSLNEIVRGSFRSAYLGYWIGAPFARRGYMTEALALGLRVAFEDLGLHRVEANIVRGNRASMALVRRAGFRREGLSRRYLHIAGRWRDHERWALLSDEWRRRSRRQKRRTRVAGSPGRRSLDDDPSPADRRERHRIGRMAPLLVSRRSTSSLVAALVTATLLTAGDWTNNGGNAARNGRSDEVGAIAADTLWDTSRVSIIAWQPMIVGRRVFVVRQTGFPPGGEPNGSPVVCQDLDTGAELWFRNIPFAAGDWTTWILGASNGQLYVSRSGNGASVARVFHALDQVTGATLWSSAQAIDAGPYDGIVFAPNGDPVIGNSTNVRRVSAADGTTVWTSPRSCNVTGSCGVALGADAVYVVEPAPGGNVIRKMDLATGAGLYQTPVMIGFTAQNTPFVGPDGTLYFSRTQNNTVTDFFYAYEDTGAALVEKWHVDAGWTTTSEWGCAPDDSVYMLDRDYRVRRLDQDTGATLAITVDPIALLSDGCAPHFAVDGSGKVFVSNGGFARGRLYSFNDDLSLRWSLAVPSINQGGPALGADGTVIVAGTGTSVHALRSSCQAAAAAVARNAGPNPASLATNLPVLGSTFVATVDLTTTGHNRAILWARPTPTDVTLGGGQHLLCSGPKLYQAWQFGPLATFPIAIPNDASLCGLTVCMQAVHFGGVTPFALSNAVDLVMGG